ncbi:MAG: glycosyltransferase [Sphingobacteriales bacterium]|nr:MAG: glycosyltransferase [Sphingobacteriales bacterium]
MSNAPLITVIIPAYNAGKTIKTAVLSVLHQTYPSVELIVVDGLSKDNTLQILSELQHVRPFKVISEKDKGVYDAMNKGIVAATGEWVYFLGGDDELYNNEVFKDIFSKPGTVEADMVYGNIWLTEQKKISGGPFTRKEIFWKNISHQAIIYKKALFDRLGVYDMTYKIMADYVFNLKIFAQNDLKLKYVDIVVASFGEEGLSSTRRDEQLKKDRTWLVWQYYSLPYYLYAVFAVPFIDLFKNKLKLIK